MQIWWSNIDLHTLFPKRDATSISRFLMVTLHQGQWPRIMFTKGIAPGRNFKWGSLAHCHQEHCRNEIWPKVHWHKLLPKRKATSEKLRFFGEECGIFNECTSLGRREVMDLVASMCPLACLNLLSTIALPWSLKVILWENHHTCILILRGPFPKKLHLCPNAAYRYGWFGTK